MRSQSRGERRSGWLMAASVVALLTGCDGSTEADERAASTVPPHSTAVELTTPPSPSDSSNDVEAGPFLDDAIDVVEGNAYYAVNVNWEQWRDDAIAVAADAESTAATYEFVRDLVAALDDDHSQFFTADEVQQLSEPSTQQQLDQSTPFGEVGDDGIGYLNVPAFSAFDLTGTEVTDYVEASYSVLDQPACGWVIDLTGNQGGNVLPMLTALAPILGPGEATGYTTRDSTTVMYEITDDGSLIADIGIDLLSAPESFPGFLHTDTPNAVLQGRQTASSGEATLIALRGHGARSFGRPTYGVPTGNEFKLLADGSAINLTTAVGTDLSGTRYDTEIDPDVEVSANVQDTREAATTWLAETAACNAFTRDE